MKHFLLTLALLVAPMGALAYNADDYERPLELARRDRQGTLINDVRRIQTYNGVVHQTKVARNYAELKHLIVCSITPDNCVARKTSDYLNRTRSE